MNVFTFFKSILSLKRLCLISLLIVVASVIVLQKLSSSPWLRTKYNYCTTQLRSMEVLNLSSQLQHSSSLATFAQPQIFKTALELSAAFSNQQPPAYGDPKALGGCTLSGNRFELYNVLVWWMQFAATHNITWFLTYGSLLGQYRNKDIIPHDTDMDVGVLLDEDKEALLRNVQTPRKQLLCDKPNLVIRPNGYCPFDSKEKQRQDCHGIYRANMVDECSFCGPVGRVTFGYNFLDLFRYMYNETWTETVFYEGMFYRSEPAVLNTSLLFPLQECQFMGMTVPCPKEKEKMLKLFLYGDLRPHKKCNGKIWIASSKSK